MASGHKLRLKYLRLRLSFFFLFFFQAEDGIRDWSVTGVQTCALPIVADLWSSRIRTSDVLARLGGDEFGLLLYNCDVHRATVIAQGFCNSIQSFRFTYNGRVFKIGVSIGVVPIDPHDKETESIQAILGLADNACYQAKQLGRNRIQLYRQEHPLPTAASEGNRLRSRLTEALETDSFCLYQIGRAHV